MATPGTRLRDSRSWQFDLARVRRRARPRCLGGPARVSGGLARGAGGAVGVPLIVVVARFPMVLDGEDGGIEIGFDSSILMFLLCTLDARAALAVWSLGVWSTQLTSGKRLAAQVFNIGVGIVAGAVAALAACTWSRGAGIGTPRELLAVAVAADGVLLRRLRALGRLGGHRLRHPAARPPACSPAPGWRSPASSRSTCSATSAAVVLRSAPWWTLTLLDGPAGHAARGHPGHHPRARERPTAHRPAGGRGPGPDAARARAGRGRPARRTRAG